MITFLLFVAGALAAEPLVPITGIAVDDPIPDWPFALDGEPTTLSAVAGERFVTFWASSCAPCLRELSEIHQLVADGRYEGIRFVALNVDRTSQVPRARALLEEAAFPGVAGWIEDQALVREVTGAGIPRSFVVAADGRVRAAQVGYSGPGSVGHLIDQADARDRRLARAAERAARREARRAERAARGQEATAP